MTYKTFSLLYLITQSINKFINFSYQTPPFLEIFQVHNTCSSKYMYKMQHSGNFFFCSPSATQCLSLEAINVISFLCIILETFYTSPKIYICVCIFYLPTYTHTHTPLPFIPQLVVFCTFLFLLNNQCHIKI